MDREQDSKAGEQMGLAVYIARAFMDEVGRDRALEVIGQAYEQYMTDTISRRLEGIPPGERLKAWGEFLKARAATDPAIKVKEASARRVAVEVSRCIAYEACQRHEVPELCRERCRAESAAAKAIGPDVKMA